MFKSHIKKALICASIILSSASCVAQTQTPRTAFVHLFEWKWLDVAAECEQHLGPKGFSAVQVSPPQQSDYGDEWWRRYQPTGYAIDTRSGNRAQFKEMVDRCAAVNVDIYADLVINHMAAYDRNFPSVPYTPDNFHVDFCPNGINYQFRDQVQFCDLLALNDLKTSSYYVRQKIADYINDLLSLGVKGFRVDGAKHIPANDIKEIFNLVNGNPYIFQEVIGAANEPVKPIEYIGNGDVTEFNFSKTVGYYFKQGQQMSQLFNIGIWQNWLASSDAVVFVSNHDEQRFEADKVVTFMDVGSINYITEIFMLAYPYGYPKVMSSYYFNNFNQGPPKDGVHSGDACFDGGWVCEHRWRGIANMVGFRNATASEFVKTDWWDNGKDQLAFGRNGKGFIVINRNDSSTLTRSFTTRMAAGTYCDIIAGDFIEATSECTGPTVTVDSNGQATFSVEPIGAAAIHVGAKVGGCEPNCAEPWENAYFRGTPNNWGVSPMTRTNTLWETTQYFGTGNPRFKISRFPDWREAVPTQDVLISEGPGFYKITLDDSTAELSISVNKVTAGDIPVSFTCQNGSTQLGQSVYVVGGLAELGAWNPAQAIKLEPSIYPTWTGTIDLPDATPFEWKCIKRSETSEANLVWQQGNDNEGYVATGLSVQASF